jgi:hypothetical protein
MLRLRELDILTVFLIFAGERARLRTPFSLPHQFGHQSHQASSPVRVVVVRDHILSCSLPHTAQQPQKRTPTTDPFPTSPQSADRPLLSIPTATVALTHRPSTRPHLRYQTPQPSTRQTATRTPTARMQITSAKVSPEPSAARFPYPVSPVIEVRVHVEARAFAYTRYTFPLRAPLQFRSARCRLRASLVCLAEEKKKVEIADMSKVDFPHRGDLQVR